MDKNGAAAYLFGILMSMNSEYNMFSGLTLDEMLMAVDHKIMSITLKLTFEIRELIEEGYSYEQIYSLIQDIKFNDEDKESGVVLEVLQKGYMYKDRVLRTAMVKVNE